MLLVSSGLLLFAFLQKEFADMQVCEGMESLKNNEIRLA
jgi:hypothetical protein